MQLLSNFDIFSDFWSDPQLKAIFKDEYEAKVSSKEMWAVMLYTHPESKYASLDAESKAKLISADYIPFDPSLFLPTIEKTKLFLLTKAQRSLVN